MKIDKAHWLSDYKVREAIYEKEKTDAAALFLQHMITMKPIGRSFLIQHKKELFYISKVICHHEGILRAIVVLMKRLFNKCTLSLPV